MIGIVVPAHQEQALIGRCVDALQMAARHPDLAGEPVRILVVLDACTDDTGLQVMRHRASALRVNARNVGAARAAGAAALIAEGARWLAFTDADSTVDACWLPRQLDLEADAVCGCVTVDDWREHSVLVRERYDAHYVHADGHRHVHGANLGVARDAYLRAGGFRPLATGEDVALVDALQRTGARIAWSGAPRVRTSGRRQARAPAGFAAFLNGLHGPADRVA